MDRIFWGPNWYWPPDEEFFEKLEKALQRDSWVLDGNYTRSLPIKWKSVEVVVWLDYPFGITVFRAVRRAIRRSLSGEEIWEGTGNRETFRKSFFSKDSIIWWTLKTYHQVKRKYKKMMVDPQFSHIRFVRIKSDAEADRFLRELESLYT
ncbi:MAG: adenylate kinase [Bdellovibrionales bacterium]